MKRENTVMFNVSAYRCVNPQKLWQDIKPNNCIKAMWIPQTIADQIWMWFEFKNEDDKNKYIEWINNCDIYCDVSWVLPDGVTKDYPKNMFVKNSDYWTQEKIDHWCS